MTDDWDDEETSTAHTSDGKPRGNSDEAYDEAAGAIKAFMERMDSIDERIVDARDDKKELYAELKASGYDKKAFDAARKVVKLREDRSKVEAKLELRAIASIYLTALGQDDFDELL